MEAKTALWVSGLTSGATSGALMGLVMGASAREHIKGTRMTGFHGMGYGAVMGLLAGAMTTLLYHWGIFGFKKSDTVGLLAVDRNPTTFRYLK